MVTTALNLPNIACFRALANVLKNLPHTNFWTAYDAEADVLYINFHSPPLAADDSELTDDDIVIRYKNNQIVGLTFLNIRKHDSGSITH